MIAEGVLLASGGYVPIRLYRVASSATGPVASAGATDYATGLLFSPDGRYLVSALADNVESTAGAIKVWSVIR
jgi:WD40 repeat protein